MKRSIVMLAVACSLWVSPARAQATLSSSSIDAITQRLELTPEQRQAVAQALYEADSAMVDIHGDIRKAELQLSHLLDSPSPNEKAILRAVDELGKAKAAVLRNRTELLLDLQDVITAEQWLQLKQLHRRLISQDPSETTNQRSPRSRRNEHQRLPPREGPGHEMSPPPSPESAPNQPGDSPPPTP